MALGSYWDIMLRTLHLRLTVKPPTGLTWDKRRYHGERVGDFLPASRATAFARPTLLGTRFSNGQQEVTLLEKLHMNWAVDWPPPDLDVRFFETCEARAYLPTVFATHNRFSCTYIELIILRTLSQGLARVTFDALRAVLRR